MWLVFWELIAGGALGGLLGWGIAYEAGAAEMAPGWVPDQHTNQ